MNRKKRSFLSNKWAFPDNFVLELGKNIG